MTNENKEVGAREIYAEEIRKLRDTLRTRDTALVAAVKAATEKATAYESQLETLLTRTLDETLPDGFANKQCQFNRLDLLDERSRSFIKVLDQLTVQLDGERDWLETRMHEIVEFAKEAGNKEADEEAKKRARLARTASDGNTAKPKGRVDIKDEAMIRYHYELNGNTIATVEIGVDGADIYYGDSTSPDVELRYSMPKYHDEDLMARGIMDLISQHHNCFITGYSFITDALEEVDDSNGDEEAA